MSHKQGVHPLSPKWVCPIVENLSNINKGQKILCSESNVNERIENILEKWSSWISLSAYWASPGRPFLGKSRTPTIETVTQKDTLS